MIYLQIFDLTILLRYFIWVLFWLYKKFLVLCVSYELKIEFLTYFFIKI